MKLKTIKYTTILLLIILSITYINRSSILTTGSYKAIEGEFINVRWGDGTLFLVDDQIIIREYLKIMSNLEYVVTEDQEVHYGFIYWVSYGNISINDRGMINDQYLLKDPMVLTEIEDLLHDYLPAYRSGQLEFQSDLMPDSHFYMLVEVVKVENNILYFKDHQETYSFEVGHTECDQDFNRGDIVETEGRLSEGRSIDIMAYNIRRMQ